MPAVWKLNDSKNFRTKISGQKFQNPVDLFLFFCYTEFSYEIRLGYRQETDMNLRKTTAKSNMMMRMGMSMNFRYL